MGCNSAKLSPPQRQNESTYDYNEKDIDYIANSPIFSSKTIPTDDAMTIKHSYINDSITAKHSNTNYPITAKHFNTNDSMTPKHSHTNDPMTAKISYTNDHIEFQTGDPRAFNDSFLQQRRQTIRNSYFQSMIETWRPKSLQQLCEFIQTLSKGKSLIEQYWIIFYWIATNISYDTISYLTGKEEDQSPQAVFRTKKALCAGYANLYKHLCDQTKVSSVIVSGYAKGYGFENRTDAPSTIDHAWNAIEIDHRWYLLDSAWGAGHLNDKKEFIREFSPYYFLTPPNEMIYHHFPEEEKWQLLRNPIGMAQYLQLPLIYPLYFKLQIELVNPRNQGLVSLLPGKPYALVLFRTPPDVYLTADLNFEHKKIEGGSYITYDKKKRLHQCHFAPVNRGKHEIHIYGKGGNSSAGTYSSVMSLTLDVRELPRTTISFPKIWNSFTDLALEIISPTDTHLIQLYNGATHATVRIKAPDDVLLVGRLKNEKEKEVPSGSQVYYDRRKNIWCCNFAPDRDGTFEALIMAKKYSDPGGYTSAVAFKIQAKQIPSPPLSYPYTWQAFYDYDLEIQVPQESAHVTLTDDVPFADVLIKAPDHIHLSCSMEYNKIKVDNGSLAQFDHTNKVWQLLFAPQRTGHHELFVYARRNNAKASSSEAVVKFNFDVYELRRSIKFPTIYAPFHNTRCHILSPISGVLNRGSVVPFHCIVPDAIDVKITVDSEWVQGEMYNDSILQRKIVVGSSEVAIWAKFGQKPSYDALIKYIVH